MIKKWIIYFTLLFPAFIFSQKKDSLKPGTTTSISFIIENKNSLAKTYNLKAETSNNFIIPILKNGEITISPNEIKTYIARVIKISCVFRARSHIHHISFYSFIINNGLNHKSSAVCFCCFAG
jgi:hypothetical protein